MGHPRVVDSETQGSGFLIVTDAEVADKLHFLLIQMSSKIRGRPQLTLNELYQFRVMDMLPDVWCIRLT